jgi:FMN reductase
MEEKQMTVTILVGNPKPRSRTYLAAHLVAQKLTDAAPDHEIDLVDFGAALLDWSDAHVAKAITKIQESDLVVVASPTYKASYTGLLKIFLDRIGGGALAGVTAVPLMLGGDLRHSLAADMLLKPVLVELGATCPTSGLFLVDAEFSTSPTLGTWLARARPQVTASIAGSVRTALPT